jgi:pilus assembly protein CpaB
MKPKTLVLMGVAIACGLGASYMTSRLLAERNAGDEPKIDVLVAKKMLNIGDTIKSPEESFQVKRFTKGDEPAGAVTDMNDLKNRVLKRPLRPGDHVTPEDLLGDQDGNAWTMPIVLPAGYRAVGVRVNLESGAFGWATLPLARVDVISTMRRADDKATHSRVLLEDVLVLAADDRMRRDENGKSMPSQIVTLALKPEDVLKVRLAGELGGLSLALRKINDKSRIENNTLTLQDLKTGGQGQQIVEVDPTTKPPEPPAQAVTTVPPASVAVKPGNPPAPKVEPKESFTKHMVAVSEGGKTRYFEYYFNAAGQIVTPPTGATVTSEQHPPRPPDALVDPDDDK